MINRSILALFAREHSGTDRIGAGGYRADIDGLRAVAILSVVIYRAVKDVARGGFVGVDFFRYLRVPDQRRLLSGPDPTHLTGSDHCAGSDMGNRLGRARAGRIPGARAPDLGGRGVRVESRSDT